MFSLSQNPVSEDPVSLPHLLVYSVYPSIHLELDFFIMDLKIPNPYTPKPLDPKPPNPSPKT